MISCEGHDETIGDSHHRIREVQEGYWAKDLVGSKIVTVSLHMDRSALTSPSGRNFYLKTEGQKWHVSFCLIFLNCCCQICWGNIFCSSNYWKKQQPRGHSKLNVLSKPSMAIPSAPKVHTKYWRHSCCQLRTFWTHWAIFEFTAVYDAKRNRTEEVGEFTLLKRIMPAQNVANMLGKWKL